VTVRPVLVALCRAADPPPADDWLAPEESERLACFRFERRRAEWRLGRWTAKVALREAIVAAGGEPPSPSRIAVRTADDGAPEPFVGQRPFGWAISLSHRGGWALCAVAAPGTRIGCDLELVEPRTEGFVGDYFTEAERMFVATAPDRDLAANLVWSAKESALKALRTGLRVDTRSVDVDVAPDTGTVDWSPFEVRRSGPALSGWWRRRGSLVLTVLCAPASPSPRLFD